MEEEMEIPKEFEYLLRRVRSLQMVLGGQIHEQKVREAAEQGDAKAQFELAGDAKSQFELANMYFHAPEGVERNIVLCEQWNDKALANDPDNVQSQNMQAYMLAERLRRVKNPPVITDVQSFTFTPLPTDIGNRFNPGDRGEKTYSVCCEACSAAVPVDRDKKYCGFCKVMVYCSKACQETDWKRHKKVCGKEGSQTPRAGQAGVQSGHRRDRGVSLVDVGPGALSAGPVLHPLERLSRDPNIHARRYRRREPHGGSHSKKSMGARASGRRHEATNGRRDCEILQGRPDETQVPHRVQPRAPRPGVRGEGRVYHDCDGDPGQQHAKARLGDLAFHMAVTARERGLVEYVKSRTTLPTSVDEMTASYDEKMK
jgi:hypothetical protein